MAAVSFTTFLANLATFMAAQASIERTNTPRALWTYQMVEADSTLGAATPTPASVLRIYDGALGYVPVPHVNIQCMTTGVNGDDEGAMARAQLLHGTLLDASKRPLRAQAITGFRINGILDLRAPGQIGRDEKGRALVGFNFEVEFVATS